MKFFSKKDAKIFGRYVLQHYFCTRNRERCGAEMLEKIFLENLPEIFGELKIVLTFAPAIEKTILRQKRKSSLKEITYQQVVQER